MLWIKEKRVGRMIKLKAGYKSVIHMKNAKNKYELPVGVVERIRIYYYNINNKYIRSFRWKHAKYYNYKSTIDLN
jgi:hypothetical protein